MIHITGADWTKNSPGISVAVARPTDKVEGVYAFFL